MDSFYERFKDHIDFYGGTVVLTESKYDAIVSDAQLERAAVLEEERQHAKAADQEWQDWERWATEVLTDFKIPFDNHKVGMRLGITQWMADKLHEADDRVAACVRIRARMTEESDQHIAVLEEKLALAQQSIEEYRSELGL